LSAPEYQDVGLSTAPVAADSWPPVGRSDEPPRIVVLGKLEQLTAGGTVGPDDGFGGAGASGSR
jgi:hypothetical protein